MSVDLRKPSARDVARTLLAEATIAHVIEALRAGGVRAVVLKGPGFAYWLYADREARVYDDVDLLIRAECMKPAAAVLAQLGYSPVPRLFREYSQTWVQGHGGASVDLHRSLQPTGLDAKQLWAALSERTTTISLGESRIEILDAPATALLAALHVAHHGSHPRPSDDLARAVDRLDRDTWRAAAALAQRLEAGSAFAGALRSQPGGRALADALGLSAAGFFDIAALGTDAPLQVHTLAELMRRRGVRGKARALAEILAPTPGFLRSWSGLARRGPAGLALAYALRPLRIVATAPAALLAWRRARVS